MKKIGTFTSLVFLFSFSLLLHSSICLDDDLFDKQPDSSKSFEISYRRLMTPSTPPPMNGGGGDGKKSSSSAMPIMISILVLVVCSTSIYCVYCWRWRSQNRAIRRAQRELANSRTLQSSDLPFMDLDLVLLATNNFSDNNKLGEGGFGPVYRGRLDTGKEIAVKRLSTKSKQGTVEFKNEVELIAKLQHRNLVRMLGCCVDKEEKLLIYEYLPNTSLDAFLFDPSKKGQLNWRTRHNIIVGIARGLLYLHEDSLLKIIHRDLKPSNVLLDNDMNPKICDFGMAKICEDGESEVENTSRVVGTFGYMAPEYAREGIFSLKSDVFSFGVLLLEILSGERNGASYLRDNGQTLLVHAWKLWNENRATEFMDSVLKKSYSMEEAWRCFQVGLLCVQENPEERPTMSYVVLTLRTEQMPRSEPMTPPSYSHGRAFEIDGSSSGTSSSTKVHSINEVTLTYIEPR